MPIDIVSDLDIARVLKEAQMPPSAVDEVIANRGKFRALLSEIYSAGLKEDFGTVKILSNTLEVALGWRDPRRKDNDPLDEDRVSFSDRPWYNG